MAEIAQRDPVHEAEVAFLGALAAGKQPPKLSSFYSKADRYRAADRARQRARKAGRAFFHGGLWFIKDAGRAWLAQHTAAAPSGDATAAARVAGQDDGGARG